MDTLPTEILIQIFEYCTLSNSILPSTLSEVSRQFYTIVHSSPQIWTLISNTNNSINTNTSSDTTDTNSHPTTVITPRFNRTRWQMQSSLYISRSYPLQISIDVRTEEGTQELLLALLAPFWKAWRRWKSIRVNGHELRIEETIPSHGSTLHIAVGNDYPPPSIWKPVYLPAHSTSSTHPNNNNGDGGGDAVQHKHSNSVDDEIYQRLGITPSMSMDLRAFPHYGTLLCGSLPFTVLSIQDNNDQATTSKIISLLSQCPNLKTFSYAGTNPSASGPDIPTSPPLQLTKLHNLIISRTYLARPILSSLALPHLRILSLDSLNVEAELPTPIIEQGDSDDEADDFSRSPSSDRMTGVGLLRLIEHSPGQLKGLKKLRMDFTDVRTRDFRVIFRELEGLEAFKIVGSDLSDGVVRLLGVHGATRDVVRHLVGDHSAAGDRLVGRGVREEAAAAEEEEIEEVIERRRRRNRLNGLGGSGGSDNIVDNSEAGEAGEDDAGDDVELIDRKGSSSSTRRANGKDGEGIKGDKDGYEHVDDGEGDAYDDGAWIWLPNLQMLQLISCPQASGSVLVSTLVERFRFTQSRPKRFRTIERLAIVDCDQFTDRHADELRGVLTPSRFRMSGWTTD